MKKLVSIILICFLLSPLYAQQHKADSLKQLLLETEIDTTKVHLLLKLSRHFEHNDPDKALHYANRSLVLAEDIGYTKGIGDSYHRIGTAYLVKSDYNRALNFLFKALEIHSAVNNFYGEAKALNNIGLIYYWQQKYEPALEYFQDSYEKAIQSNDSLFASYSTVNTGLIYSALEEYDQALEYYFKTIDLAKDYSSGARNRGFAYDGIGEIYLIRGDKEKALEYFEKSLQVRSITQSHYDLISSYINLGEYYRKTNQLTTGIEYLEKAIELADRGSFLERKKGALQELSTIYAMQGQYEKAYNTFVKFHALHDTINNETTVKRMTELEMQYQFEQEKRMQEVERQKQAIIKNEELQHQKNIKNMMIAGLVLFGIFLLVLLNSYRIKRRDNQLLAMQKSEIMEQNEELQQQKAEIEAQRDYTDKQKEMIIQQKAELEKHRNHLELLVQKRTGDLEMAKKRAESSDKLKSAFLANMSHEIRTPMNSIMGFTSLLGYPNLSDEQRQRYVNLVKKNSSSLLYLIDNIITISKIEANDIKIEKTDCEIHNMLNDLVMTAKEQRKIHEKDHLEIKIEKSVDSEEYSIITDEYKLRQILSNLLENAIKYTEKGFIEFGYKFISDKSIQFYVRDSGIGMPQEKLTSIFNKFEKIVEPKNKLYRGSGLGLSIAKKLTELLGGELFVESTYGKGSTFYIDLPHKRVRTKRHVYVPSKKYTYTWDNKLFLITEDEEDNYKYIAAILSKTNSKIIWAKNGREAVEQFKEHRNIDLVLMDIQMPEMNGYEATKRIKALDNSVPVIAQTAYASSADKEKSLAAGCNDHIAKPFEPESFLSVINKFIDD